MKRIYGLRNDKENISLIIGDDKAMLIIQTAESYKVRDLNLEFDVESDKSVSLEEIKPINISANDITGGNIAQFVRDSGNAKNTNQEKTDESEVYEENGMIGIKTESLNSNIVQSIDELSTKLDDLDNKINLKVDTKEFWDFVKYYKDETQQKEQPEPVQRALNRIKEIDRVTDVRIDEEFKATDFNRAENRLTITIDYLDVDIVKEMEKVDKYKLY